MRIRGLLFSTIVLAATASTRAQSLTAPSLLPNAPRPNPAFDPLARNYLVPHDSRNQLPRIVPAVQASKQALGDPTFHLGKPAAVVLIARNSPICYTVRMYNLPTEKDADVTRPTSSTTCEAPKSGSLMRSTVQILR